MLRDPALIPLSQQHHNGLALCVLTRRGLAADAGLVKLAKRIIDRYELELINHFEIEEQVLFPLCAPSPLIEQLLADHRTLEALVEKLRVEPTAAILEEFCELLSTHIRREERELYEQAQRTIPREALNEAGKQIDQRAVRLCL
jgi:hemerythrin-like domain-containing protein